MDSPVGKMSSQRVPLLADLASDANTRIALFASLGLGTVVSEQCFARRDASW